ncbi:hypothetical protein X747_14405 [Mesorhizobium sp. LNJC384A00]|uniref:hypothetical protein n=1 Tax=Mesorhizobium sp. LNJC384A00 TaxID=1287268 RepID=UPI0003CE7359|nr:hypothetical protein [Mesorhizobium sp. LNJC384A00]ESY41997.1 hypothetical protein X747_14405 [Mesorhizobium sp. LNJC384A00]
MSKPVAKSLHTVSALVNVARYFLGDKTRDPDRAIGCAVYALKLDGKPDPYGLIAIARKQLDKGTP